VIGKKKKEKKRKRERERERERKKNATDWLTKRGGPLNGPEWDAGTRPSPIVWRSTQSIRRDPDA